MADLQLLDGGAVARPHAGRSGAGRLRAGAVRHLRPVPPPRPRPEALPEPLSLPGPLSEARAGQALSGPALDPRPAPSRPAPVRPAPGRSAHTRPLAPPFPRTGGRPAPQRVLVRPVRALPPHIVRRRRAAATAALAVATMLAVLLLGVLADVAAAARAGGPASTPVTERTLVPVVPGSWQALGPGWR